MSAASPAAQTPAIIAAVARNGGIGLRGELPWRLPGDLRHFRRLTLGKPVIMGRRTHLSIGAPLPGRRNIVLSSDSGLERPGADGVRVAGDLAEALRIAAECEAAEAMIIGGARLYREALPLARRLYLTRVDAEPEADAFFPPLDWSEWRERESRAPTLLPEDQHSYRFLVLDRIK